jgi:hypothetical protein
MLEEEISGVYLDPLFKQMTDDCMALGCSTIYTDLDETDEEAQGRKRLYDDYCASIGVYIAMQDAPFRSNWQVGVNLVRGFTGKGLLSIPEGPTRAQLSAAVAMDLQAADDAVELHRLRALQYVVGAFHKSPASAMGPYRPNRGASRHKR